MIVLLLMSRFMTEYPAHRPGSRANLPKAGSRSKTFLEAIV
jgi:hypothetical protein